MNLLLKKFARSSHGQTIIQVVFHIGAVALLSFGIWLLERQAIYLWGNGNGDPKFWNSIPIKYFFHSMDAAVIILLGLYVVAMLMKIIWKALKG